MAHLTEEDGKRAILAASNGPVAGGMGDEPPLYETRLGKVNPTQAGAQPGSRFETEFNWEGSETRRTVTLTREYTDKLGLDHDTAVRAAYEAAQRLVRERGYKVSRQFYEDHAKSRDFSRDVFVPMLFQELGWPPLPPPANMVGRPGGRASRGSGSSGGAGRTAAGRRQATARDAALKVVIDDLLKTTHGPSVEGACALLGLDPSSLPDTEVRSLQRTMGLVEDHMPPRWARSLATEDDEDLDDDDVLVGAAGVAAPFDIDAATAAAALATPFSDFERRVFENVPHEQRRAAVAWMMRLSGHLELIQRYRQMQDGAGAGEGGGEAPGSGSGTGVHEAGRRAQPRAPEGPAKKAAAPLFALPAAVAPPAPAPAPAPVPIPPEARPQDPLPLPNAEEGGAPLRRVGVADLGTPEPLPSIRGSRRKRGVVDHGDDIAGQSGGSDEDWGEEAARGAGQRGKRGRGGRQGGRGGRTVPRMQDTPQESLPGDAVAVGLARLGQQMEDLAKIMEANAGMSEKMERVLGEVEKAKDMTARMLVKLDDLRELLRSEPWKRGEGGEGGGGPQGAR